MSAAQPKIPGPDHPITITRSQAHLVVSSGGTTIADTTNALTLQEASYKPVHYIPRTDVDMAQLERTTRSTYCPYKGDCVYFSIPAGGGRTVNAVWSYENPYPSVAEIKDHLAFYSDRVDISVG